MEMYQALAENYDSIFPYKPAHKKFILSAGTKRRALLDMGCATGALAEHLVQQFNEISAFDISKAMIEKARMRKVPKVDYFSGSMLKAESYFWKKHFDVISCFGNTLVHLKDEDELLTCFSQVRSILKENGVFLGQIINYDNILDNGITSLPTIDNSHIRFVRHYHFNSDVNRIVFDTTLTIKQTGKSIDNTVQLLPIRKIELENLLLKAGFSTVEFYSDYKRSEYSPTSLPLLFQASIE